MLQPDVSWKEKYVSSGLNRQMQRLIGVGCYSPVSLSFTGLEINVDDADAVYVAERDGYSVSVRGDGSTPVTTGLTAIDDDDSYLVLDVYYSPNATTTARFLVVDEAGIEDYHVIAAKMTAVSGEVVTYSINKKVEQPAGIDLGAL